MGSGPRGKLIIPAARSVVKASELIPVIGYARVSTWREEMISIDIQQSVVEESAARQHRYVAEWIIDEDATGRNFKRKVMRAIEIVEDAARPERELWAWKFSRFGRNRHGVAINLARIEDVGGELVSATEAVDAKTAVGRLTRGVLLEIAAFESDRAGEQWKETHELRRRLGLPAAGGRRFGYVWHPRRLPDGRGGWILQEERYEALPDEAELSVEAFQDYIRGKTGFGRIAQRWNDLGFLNTRGARWQDQGVKGFMDSGFAAGLLYVHNPDAPCGDPSGCKNSDHYAYLAAEHESIIDGAEWDNYRDMRAVRRNTPRRALSPVYPLAGLVRCGLCGSSGAIHQTRTERGKAYRCHARARRAVEHEAVWVRRAVVEGEVLAWLVDLRQEIDGIVAGTVAVPQQRREPDVDKLRAKLQRDVERATGAIDKAFNAYTLGDVDRDTYLRTRATHEQTRNEAQQQLDELPAPGEEPASPVPHREVVVGLIAEWDTISVQSKRVMLGRVIRRVEVRPGDDVKVVPVWAPADERPKRRGPGRLPYRP
ncbi:recombinase family protein [Streptomyces mirabilis]|uniref:recombinase family protein n=1 Tax=Streptomyces mirabilis TaxID=68239 RepID=UPI00225B7104|nr:recombinase family protein [Streptomyces mirabilis]MCX4615754.1 recombinase family protein [Streptomyces mirabilis]